MALPAAPLAPRPLYRVAAAPRRFPGDFLVSFRRDSLGTVRRMASGGSDVTIASAGPFRLVLLNHPDLARDLFTDTSGAYHKSRALRLTKILLGEGLLTSEAPFHTRQRRLILPAFHHQRLRAYAEAMVARTEALASTWQDGQVLDADEAMMRLTLEIAAGTLFGADVGDDVETVRRAIATCVELFRRTANPLAGFFLKLPLPSTRRLNAAVADLDRVVYRVIAGRRAGHDGHTDLLAMLLAAQDEETGAGMTDQQVRDEVMTLFLAGHETTANALTWALYLLAQHPDAEARLQAEADALGRAPSFDDLPRLPFARQVFAEALRLYPPAWIIGRETTRAVEIGGAEVPPRSTVFVSPFLLHRDARWWDAPEVFRPERFAPGAGADRPKFAYLPFGAGRRGCIGEQFAWTEGVLVLAALAQRWRLHRADDREVRPFPSITLRPGGPVRMRAERRS
ncbi:MAG TPA: cytochrome P450 [Rubricoccaceae bacterium]|nr:cytochrome P450 [Rubricoccaceae bacterium]